MDRLLAQKGSAGLHVPSFARKWRVSEKTVRRDLAAFAELGREAWQLVIEVSGQRDRPWQYKPDVRPLFRHDPPPGKAAGGTNASGARALFE
jgi:hypothetical protein